MLAPSEPIDLSCTQASVTSATHVLHALSEITVMLLLKGLIYLETAKHDSLLKVLCHIHYTTLGGLMDKLSTYLLRRVALSPCLQAVVLATK